MMDPSRQPAAIALGKHGGAGTAGGPRKKYSNSMRHVQIADMIVEAQKSQRRVPSHDMRSVHHLQQHALHMHQQQMQNMRLAAGQGSIAGVSTSIAGVNVPPMTMVNGSAAASQHALASQQQVQYLIQQQIFILIILVSDHCSDRCVSPIIYIIAYTNNIYTNNTGIENFAPCSFCTTPRNSSFFTT
jgi:hypothetical protein